MVSENIQAAIYKWWIKMQDNNGGKAQLKRCSTPEEAALHPETHRLKTVLPNWIPFEMVATIAGLSAHVEGSSQIRFIESLATPKEKNGRVPLSESRFRQMLSCRDWDELYRSLRRGITILDGTVNYPSFVETVFLWNDEFHKKDKPPGKGVKYQLSRAYYETALKYEK